MAERRAVTVPFAPREQARVVKMWVERHRNHVALACTFADERAAIALEDKLLAQVREGCVMLDMSIEADVVIGGDDSRG